MNTGLLRHAVATALTVYGIETFVNAASKVAVAQLQQHLPFTVLKLIVAKAVLLDMISCNSTYRLRY